MATKFELTILGSGSATPTLLRNPPVQILQIRNHLFLIDCGEGAQIALRRQKIKFQRIKHVFISHLHGDHYLGLPGLLSTLNLLGRKESLTVYGPAGLKEIIDLHFKHAGTVCNYPLIFETIHTESKQLIFENKVLSVYALPLKHRIETYGYLFVEKPKLRHINSQATQALNVPYYFFQALKEGQDYTDENTGKVFLNHQLTFDAEPARSYAYCSDTAFNPELIPWIKDVDILFHETTFMNQDQVIAHKTFHSTTIEAATVAKKAQAKHLIIGHYSSRYQNIDLLTEECQTIFKPVTAAYDGLLVTHPSN